MRPMLVCYSCHLYVDNYFVDVIYASNGQKASIPFLISCVSL
jgi:hypothetical protein